MPDLIVKTHYHVTGGPCTHHHLKITCASHRDNLAEALVQLDRLIIEGLAHAPLLVQEVSVQFCFDEAIPRAVLSQSWIDAAASACGIVAILDELPPDDGEASQAVPDRSRARPRPLPTDIDGDDAQRPRKGKGASHGS